MRTPDTPPIPVEVQLEATCEELTYIAQRVKDALSRSDYAELTEWLQSGISFASTSLALLEVLARAEV